MMLPGAGFMDKKINLRAHRGIYLLGLMFCITLLMVNSASALELNPFAEKKIFERNIDEDTSDFIKQDFNSNYGVIKLSKTFLWVETDKVAEYSLIENTDQCLINCEARGKAVLYSDGKLFDDKEFISKTGKKIDVNSQYYIKVKEKYIVEEPVYRELCKSGLTKNGTQECFQDLVETKKIEKEREVWKEYNGEVLKAGEYEWKIIGTKNPLKEVDFIPVARGTRLNEWAWWYSGWKYKKQVNITGGTETLYNFTIYLNVSYDSDMQSDFDDLRFIDSSNNELYYEVDYKIDSSSAGIWVKIVELATGNNIIYMYYGNDEASSGQDRVNAWDNYYRNVFHYSEASGTIYDSKGNFNHTHGTMNQNTLFGKGQRTGTGAGINTPADWMTLSTSTLELYYIWHSGHYFFDQTPGGNIQYRISIEDKYFSFSTAGATTSVTLADNSWRYMTGVYQGSGVSNKQLLYKDGILNNSANGGTLGNDPDPRLYSAWNDVQTADITIDEFRISTINRSGSWIKRSYDNINLSMFSFGDEESEGVSISLLSPENAFNSSSQTILFNSTIIPLNANITNVTWRAGNQEDSQLLNTNESISLDWTKTFADGSYSWNVTACWIGISETESCESETRTFTIDATAPSISILYPTGTINYGYLGQNVSLNYSINDANLDSCWYNYNETNKTLNCSTNSTFILTSQKNLTLWANDTVGNTNYSVASWDYLLFQSDVIYNPIALETSSQTFILVGQKATGVTSISARLFYGGVPYTSTVLTSGNNVNISNTIEIPLGTANRTLFWEVTMITGSGTTIMNTTSLNQTVENILFNICTTPTGLALNFTTYDTSTDLPLNSSFEATFSYYASGGTGDILAEYSYQNLSENRSNYLFCLNSSGLNVTLDAFISYFATGYDRREYIINDGTIGNFTVAIPLFLTQSVLTDIVTFTLEDQNYDPISDALITVQRWNVGTNTYSTVGMFETGSSGQGIMDLELYNTWYRVIVSYEGVIVYTSNVQKLGSTEWNILINLGVQNVFDLFGTISKALTYDNTTQIATYTWADSSGYTNKGCLIVQRNTPTGPQNISNSCVETVAGSINYQLIQNGTYTIYGIVYLTAEYQGVSQITDTKIVTIGTDELTTTVSPFGKVISFIAIGTSGLIGVAAGSPILGGILITLSLLGVSIAGWISGIDAIIWGIISVLIVILARQSRRGG